VHGEHAGGLTDPQPAARPMWNKPNRDPRMLGVYTMYKSEVGSSFLPGVGPSGG